MKALAIVMLLAGALAAQERPRYPEGVGIPRSMTPEEQRWVATHPITAPLAVTPPPTGPVHCVAEYEPMDGILMAWEGNAAQNAILQAMATEITVYGNANAYVVCDTAFEWTTVQSTLTAAGANMARVIPVITATDTIWIRDYGPRYVWQGDCRAIVDHTYNRPRPSDDVFPKTFATVKHHAFYEHQLVHGGGNYHLDALGRSYATRLIANENSSLTEAQIVAIWKSYQNVDTTLLTPFRTSIDSTQHLDMWVQIVGDNKAIVSYWPINPTLQEAVLCDQTAIYLQGRGYTVYRTPAFSIGGVHYTFTNVVICNQLLLVPSYTNATVAAYNAAAAAVYQQALPGYRVTQVPCEGIVPYAGVMHCIAMHVPAHKGGVNPTAYLVNLNDGVALTPSTVQKILWISDDDQAVTSVDLLLSTDGGSSFPTVIASGIPDTGSYDWSVPDLCTGLARVRVVARDAGNRTGSDDSDLDFKILGTGCAAANLPYGAGKPGAAGVPLLGSATLPRVPSMWTLDLSNALASAPAFTLYGIAPASAPYDGGTILVSYAGHFPIATSAAGTHALVVPVPDLAVLYGLSLYWQTWIPFDPGAAGFGWAATGGLQMRLGR